MSHEEFANFLNRRARKDGVPFNEIVSGLSIDLGYVIKEIDGLTEQKLVSPEKRFPVDHDRGFTLSQLRDNCAGYVAVLRRILKSQAKPEDASRLQTLGDFTSELQEIAVEGNVLNVPDPAKISRLCSRVVEGAFALAEIQSAFQDAFEAGRKSVFAEMHEAYQERLRTGRGSR